MLADGDLPLLHRFEQRALHLGRRTIDFVGQDQVREKWSELGRELASARVINEGADQIRRQKIGRELQSLKPGSNACGHCFHCQRFSQTGNALEQDVTVSEQAEQKAVDQIFLANYHMTNLLAQRRNPLAQLPHFLRNLLRRFHTEW